MYNSIIFRYTFIISMALSKVYYNDLFNVFYYERNEFDLGASLHDFGRFTAPINQLKVRKGWYILKIGQDDIR